jgi:hypothetical protein
MYEYLFLGHFWVLIFSKNDGDFHYLLIIHI